MNNSVKVLLVEDFLPDVELTKRELNKSLKSCVFRLVETREDYMAALVEFNPDLIITDYNLPRFDGLTALKLALEHLPLTPVIILTSAINENTAVDCMKKGASDYVIKEHIKRLGQAVLHALEEKEIRKERQRAEQALRESEERMRVIVEGTPNLFFYLQDSKANTTYVSPTIEQITGYSPERWMAQKNWFVTDAEFNSKAFEQTRAHLRGEYTSEPILIEVYHKNGSPILLEAYEQPFIQHGTVVGIQGVAQDITLRKKAELALRESEERFRSLYENTTVGMYRTTKDGKILLSNPAIVRMLGYSSFEELAQKNLETVGFNPNYNRQQFTDAIERDGQISGLEAQWTRRDGTTIFIRESARAIRDTQGNILYYDGIIEDITEQKQAQESLKQSFSLLSATLESTADGILVADNDGNMTNYNAQFVKMWNLPEDILSEGLDKQAITFVMEQLKYPEEFEAKVKELYSHPDTDSFDILEFKDGRVYERSSHPQRIESVPVGRVWSFRDVTIRKQAEENLHESEERYRNLVEFFPDAVAVHSEGKFIFVNPAAIKLIGASDESQLLGLPVLDIIHPDDVEAVRQRLLQGMKERRALPPVEEKFVRFDGQVIDVEVTSLPMMFKGEPAVQMVARDISEQKKLRRQLLQSQKIQSIGTLAGGIAHDFNNILGIIMGYASLLERRRTDEKKYAESVAAINQATERGAALVRQILTFARKTEVSYQTINIPDLGRELLSMLKQTFPKTITFTETYDTDLPEILADRTQIHQILLNLCVNARDAMPNGGSLMIKAEVRTQEQLQERFPNADQKKYVCLSVTDNGEGMNEATRQQIFDPFFTTKEIGKGTGLGLSVVYGVIQSHQGFVEVESRKGEGTTFFLFLPASSVAPKQVEQSASLPLELFGGSETVLLVEDEDLLLDMVHILLESQGYSVYTAQDGEKAVQLFLLHRNEIAVVLTDIGLPKMSGFDEFKKLREIDPQVKVILASGFFEPGVKLELQQSGANSFIQKPYMPEEILMKIREVLDEKPHRDQKPKD